MEPWPDLPRVETRSKVIRATRCNISRIVSHGVHAIREIFTSHRTGKASKISSKRIRQESEVGCVAYRQFSGTLVPLPAVPTTFFGRLVGTAFSLPWSTLQYRFAISSFTSRFDRIEEHARVSFQHSSSSCQTFGNRRSFVRFYIFSRSCGESSSRKRSNRSQNFPNFVPPKWWIGQKSACSTLLHTGRLDFDISTLASHKQV